MNFFIHISTLCLVAAACMFEDVSTITIDGYASSSDCGSSSAPIKGSFSLNPTGPNSVWVSVKARITEELDPPLKADIKIQRKVFWWWIKMPCLSNYGSCTYQDVCQFLPSSGNQCPKPFQDLPSCQCPLRTGEYSVESQIDIPTINLPSWLSSGDYWARIKLFENHREVGCNEIYFSV